MNFHILSGAGNIFAISNAKEKLKLNKRQIKKISRKLDGVLFLYKGQAPYHFIWDFYNSDGSKAEMCGNAARCANIYCNITKIKRQKNINFKTLAGKVETIRIQSNLVWVKMPKTRIIGVVTKKINGKTYKFNYINSGVPHAVLELHEKFNLNKLKKLAKIVRFASEFGNKGANISFYKIVRKGHIQAISYERGVEGFTQACGTGAVACAISYNKTTGVKYINVKMPGGLLKVDLRKSRARPEMIGNVKYHGMKEIKFLGG